VAAYRRVGVDTVLIRGFDPLDDVADWGTELVPLLREQAASTPAGASQSALAAAGNT
jgi:alkanesulfonate monooxygenase